MLEAIYQWGSLVIAAISTGLSIFIYIKSKKKKNTTTELECEVAKLEVVNEIAKVLQQVPDLIIKAEKTFPTTGEVRFGPAKLAWVLGEIEKLCLKNEVEYNEEQFKFEIERILETPKKGEDKENENASSKK